MSKNREARRDSKVEQAFGLHALTTRRAARLIAAAISAGKSGLFCSGILHDGVLVG